MLRYKKYGKSGTLWRDTPSEVVLVRYLREAMARLNPKIDSDAIDMPLKS